MGVSGSPRPAASALTTTFPPLGQITYGFRVDSIFYLTASSERTGHVSAACSRCPPSGPCGSADGSRSPTTAKIIARPDNAVLDASPAARKVGCSVASREAAMDMHTPVISVAPERVAELERLG